MTRQEKYPETSTFHYYNANPKNRKGGDCVVRAICTALDHPWEQTIRELTEVGIKNGFVLNDPHTYNKYLESKGCSKCPQPRKDDNKKYTGREWCDWLNTHAKYDVRLSECKAIVCNIGGNHTVCIKRAEDGLFKVHDIWDSTDGCIGNYWVIR